MELLPPTSVASILLRVARSILAFVERLFCRVCDFFSCVHPVQNATSTERTLTSTSQSAGSSDALTKNERVSGEALEAEDAYRDVRRHVGAAFGVILLALAAVVVLVLI